MSQIKYFFDFSMQTSAQHTHLHVSLSHNYIIINISAIHATYMYNTLYYCVY